MKKIQVHRYLLSLNRINRFCQTAGRDPFKGFYVAQNFYSTIYFKKNVKNKYGRLLMGTILSVTFFARTVPIKKLTANFHSVHLYQANINLIQKSVN